MTLPVTSAAFRWHSEAWGHSLRCVPLDARAQHLFTTRQLQLRPAGDAAPADVVEAQRVAWQHAAAALGANAGQLMRVRQVHGRTVRVLRAGAISPAERAAKPDADAIVSNETESVLVVQVADCVPLLMADAKTGVAAAVHAGWRGTSAGIAAAAVEALTQEFGTRAEDLTVALGPSIGACCYEVGAELVDAFRTQGAVERDLARWFTRTPAGSLRLDLWSANRDQLLAAGVPAERIHVAALCTQTHLDVFESFRAEGAAAGRMAALIRVPPRAGG